MSTRPARSAPTPWSAEEEDALRRLAAERLGGNEIGGRLGRTPSAIRQKARSRGLSVGTRRKNRAAWLESDDVQLAALAGNGISRREAGEIMRRDSTTLRNHLTALGVEWHSPKKPPAEKERWRTQRDQVALVENLAALARNGWSVGMAALELDIHSQTASKLSKQQGIQWRVRGRSVRGEPLSSDRG